MTRTRDPEKLRAQNERKKIKMRGAYARLSEPEKEVHRAADRARYKEKRAGQWIRWERQVLKAAKERAARKGLEFALQKGDLECPEICPVLFISIIVGDPQKNNSPSLDRFDNAKGYTKENVRVISNRANKLKSNATVGEMKAVLHYMEHG